MIGIPAPQGGGDTARVGLYLLLKYRERRGGGFGGHGRDARGRDNRIRRRAPMWGDEV